MGTDILATFEHKPEGRFVSLRKAVRRSPLGPRLARLPPDSLAHGTGAVSGGREIPETCLPVLCSLQGCSLSVGRDGLSWVQGYALLKQMQKRRPLPLCAYSQGENKAKPLTCGI